MVVGEYFSEKCHRLAESSLVQFNLATCNVVNRLFYYSSQLFQHQFNLSSSQLPYILRHSHAHSVSRHLNDRFRTEVFSHICTALALFRYNLHIFALAKTRFSFRVTLSSLMHQMTPYNEKIWFGWFDKCCIILIHAKVKKSIF